MTENKKTSNPKFYRKFSLILWSLMLFGILAFAGSLWIISKTKLPDPQQLENPKFEYATKIYTVDNYELGRYFRKNRDWVYFEEFSPHLVNALIATEDERYYRHSGVDTKGTIRAVAFLGRRGGASTITQQLSKLLFTNYSTNIIRRVYQKMREWVIAIRIEQRYTKEEIIAMYLNKFDFIYDSDGVAAAARTYFGKDQKDISIQEAAMLIGMLKNPYVYNPKRAPQKAKVRRSVVLKQMEKNEFITQMEYDSLKVLDLNMSKFHRMEASKGLAPHFRSELTKWVTTLLNKDEYLKPDGTPYNIYTDGLKIYTTIDSRMQRLAERAVKNNMKNVQERYSQVWKNRDPWTYNANKYEKEQRKNSLNALVRQSERYLLIKDRFMAESFSKIEQAIPEARLWDIDLIRMDQEVNNKGHLDRLIQRKIITKEQKATYVKIMNSSIWNETLNNWREMEEEVRRQFSKPIEMEVFAYNSTGEKTVTMSPLDSIKYHCQQMQSGMLAIEPNTGYVKSWVGGVDHTYFQYDHVTSNRQVGSTFKPFIYTTAIFQQGISPCWQVRDMQYTIPANDSDFGLMENWSPSNASGFSGENLTLYEGLKQSKNSVSVWLMKELGNVEVIIDLAEKMGIDREKIPSAPSICLGTPELSLMDMTSAYSTFANKGIHNDPIFVTRIENKEGQIIYNAVPNQQKVLPEDYNYVMVDMLKEAASFIRPKFESDVGGKTGTTNDYVDGWFMGITPNLVVGTWVGGDFPMIRFLTLADGQGGVMARPAFVEFMQSLESSQSIDFDTSERFEEPENMSIEIDCRNYDKIIEGDQQKVDEEGKVDDVFDEEDM